MEFGDRLEQVLNTTYAPDVILPSQYFELQTQRCQLDGEKRLMLAVLEDAVQCYLHNLNAKGHRKLAVFNEARDWMRAKSASGPFAFETICDVLGIEANLLRGALEKRRQQVLAHNARTAAERRAAA